jgi:hypothetical protein
VAELGLVEVTMHGKTFVVQSGQENNVKDNILNILNIPGYLWESASP